MNTIDFFDIKELSLKAVDKYAADNNMVLSYEQKLNSAEYAENKFLGAHERSSIIANSISKSNEAEILIENMLYAYIDKLFKTNII